MEQKRLRYWLVLDTYACSDEDKMYHAYFNTLRECKEKVGELISKRIITFYPKALKTNPPQEESLLTKGIKNNIYIAVIRKREGDRYITKEVTYNGYTWKKENDTGLGIHKDFSYGMVDAPLSRIESKL